MVLSAGECSRSRFFCDVGEMSLFSSLGEEYALRLRDAVAVYVYSSERWVINAYL